MNNQIEVVSSKISFNININTLDFAQRFDTEYYEKKWTKMINLLKESGIEFRNIQYVKQSFNPADPREQYFYITLSDIDDKSGIIKHLKSMEAHELPDRAKRMTQKGDVLVSSLKGSKDKIAIMNSDYENVIASTGFYVVRDKNYLPEVLFLIFRSKYYDMFIDQMSSGAIMSSLTDKYFKQFLVPVLSDEIQKDIAEEIQLYLCDRKAAFENLNKAISMFDDILNKPY
jgi:type I restriction enzyme S subunit